VKARELMVINIISVIISALALIVSITVAYKNRKKVETTIETGGLVNRVETFEKIPAYPDQSPGIFIIFKFLNSSPNDIGFFDITFTDLKSKELLPTLYKISLRPDMEDQKFLAITETNNPDNPITAHFNIMESNYGIIPANTFKRFETIVYPISQHFVVDIKFAIRSFRKNKLAYSRKKYKHIYRVVYIGDEDWDIIKSHQL
jgi:hypothetical protein